MRAAALVVGTTLLFTLLGAWVGFYASERLSAQDPPADSTTVLLAMAVPPAVSAVFGLLTGVAAAWFSIKDRSRRHSSSSSGERSGRERGYRPEHVAQ
jgi:hypothetical protein